MIYMCLEHPCARPLQMVHLISKLLASKWWGNARAWTCLDIRHIDVQRHGCSIYRCIHGPSILMQRSCIPRFGCNILLISKMSKIISSHGCEEGPPQPLSLKRNVNAMRPIFFKQLAETRTLPQQIKKERRGKAKDIEHHRAKTAAKIACCHWNPTPWFLDLT